MTSNLESPDPVTIGAESKVAVYKHPLHPALVTFPIAFLIGALATDAVFLYSGDAFWARASFWLVAGGTAMGLLAGLAGTVELLWARDIRTRSVAWNHFVAAVMMLSIAFANTVYRLDDHEAAILPWGIYLSALCVLFVAIAGWLGGHLVFEHKIGVEEESLA